MPEINPVLMYRCPKNDSWFRRHGYYCVDNPPCKHFSGSFVKYGKPLNTPTIQCDYQSSTKVIK